MFKCNLINLMTWLCLSYALGLEGHAHPIREPKQISRVGCLLPPFPVNGDYTIGGSSVTPVPGEAVDSLTILWFTCRPGAFLQGSATSVCNNGQWTLQPPLCIVPDNTDCSNINSRDSGVFLIKPPGASEPVATFCDFDVLGGNWTVIQSRQDGSVEFFRSYRAYQEGFGSPEGEYWLGLDTIHQLTADGDFELYVDIESFSGTTSFARYSEFVVNSVDDGYRLTVTGYSGTAGDWMDWNNGMMFSTYDKDQDTWELNCAIDRQGAWWYSYCTFSNLNGVYFQTPVEHHTSVLWYDAGGAPFASLKTARMLIRRKP